MLAEIYCDKFMDNGQQRGKITFHSGLNIVLGGDLGDNSIGKTTFLYVIDFCFGGNDYVKNADIKPIGEHEICWKLIFENRAYWYSRNTNTPKTVFSCDSHYRHLAEVSIEDYCEFLAEQYHLLETRKSFREICSAWLRIYGKDNNNAKTPLQSFRSDKASSGINRLIGLFKNTALLDAFDNYFNAEKEKTKNNARKILDLIPQNKASVKNNELKITNLEKQLLEMTSNKTVEIFALNADEADNLVSLRQKLTNKRRQKTKKLHELNAIRLDRSLCNELTPENFDDLHTFFPGTNIKIIQEIEQFHHQLSDILADEYSEEETQISEEISRLTSDIQILEQQISEIVHNTSISKKFLEQYADARRQIDFLKELNQYYKDSINISSQFKKAKEQVNACIKQHIPDLCKHINNEITRLNNIVTPNRKVPVFHIEDEKHYTFVTDDDNGTGSQNRSLILFDLAILNLSALPFLIHDSFYLKQIEDNAVENLINLYAKTSKQVFITIDKAQKMFEENDDLKSCIIMHLSKDHELFGYSWSTNKT